MTTSSFARHALTKGDKRPDGKPWAMATPFLKDGKNVYDHAGDSADKYGPFPTAEKK